MKVFRYKWLPERTSLEAFADTLAHEYEEWKKAFNVDEWNAEHE